MYHDRVLSMLPAEQFISNRKQLRKLLTERFSQDELRVLCFDLAIEYENFDENKSMFVVDLLEWLIRKQQLPQLESWLHEEDILLI